MCMLHILSRITQTGAIRIASGLILTTGCGGGIGQGRRICRDYCASNNICYLGAGDVSAYAKQNKISIEAPPGSCATTFAKTAPKRGLTG